MRFTRICTRNMLSCEQQLQRSIRWAYLSPEQVVASRLTLPIGTGAVLHSVAHRLPERDVGVAPAFEICARRAMAH